MFKTILFAIVLQTQTVSDTIPLTDSKAILKEIAELNEKEQYEKSIALLEKIAPYDSNYIDAQNALMVVLEKDGKLEEAKALGNSLLETRKDASAVSYVTLGNIYLNNGESEKGIEIYQRGRQFFPYNNALIYNMGYGYYAMGQYDKAIPLLQEVLSVNPYYKSAHSILGSIMANTGNRTKALLSYWTYLMIDADQNWALVRMNDLVNDAYRKEGTEDYNIDNSSFEAYDALLRSKAAFDDRYKTSIDFDAPIVQQSELLMSELRYVEGTGDFWMDFYVPIYIKLYEESLMEPFIYFMLYSTSSDKVKEYLEKNTKAKDQWVNLASDMLRKNRVINERTILGKTQPYFHWYYDDGTVNAIGQETNGKNTGPYYFYHGNGRLQAVGAYDELGNKIGNWEFYHENGQLSSKQQFDENGVILGEIKRYDTNGNLEEIGRYKDGKLTGNYDWYYSCGTLKETYPYVDGEGSGEGIVYYESGEVKIRYQVADDDLNGDYTTYYQNGEVKSKYANEGGKANGPYVSYYANGQKEKEGQYVDDMSEGPWLFYHNNGQLSDSGAYVNDQSVGKWVHYYRNGKIRQIESLNEEGESHGDMFWYDLDGKLYCERQYEADVLISYKFLDKSGKVIFQQADPTGNMTYKAYYPTGQLQIETSLQDGKFNGPYTSYHVNGRIEEQGVMKDNYWDGLYQQYNDFGNLIVSADYEEGQANGYYRSFFNSGQVQTEGWMNQDKANQLWHEYYPNGVIKVKYRYENAVEVGSTEYFDYKGRLVTEERYDKGVRTLLIRYDTLGNAYQELTFANNEPMEYKTVSGDLIMVHTKTCGVDVNEITSYLPGGKKKFEYIMDQSTTLKYRSFDPYGKVTVEGGYLGEEPHGTWNYYDENGKLDSSDPYVLGASDGLLEYYYADGSVKSACNYLNGTRHGACKYYDPSGSLRAIKHYKKGYGLLGYQYELEDGSLSDTIFIEQDKKQEVRAYYSTGQVSMIQEYDYGNYEGKIQFFLKDGTLVRDWTYADGNTPVRKDFHENGNIKEETTYEDDLHHGEQKFYYPNGKLRETIMWRYGIKEGWHRYYKESGEIEYEFFYRYGQIY